MPFTNKPRCDIKNRIVGLLKLPNFMFESIFSIIHGETFHATCDVFIGIPRSFSRLKSIHLFLVK